MSVFLFFIKINVGFQIRNTLKRRPTHIGYFVSKTYIKCSGKFNGLSEINRPTQVVCVRYYKWYGFKFGEKVRYSVLQLSDYNDFYPLKTRPKR